MANDPKLKKAKNPRKPKQPAEVKMPDDYVALSEAEFLDIIPAIDMFEEPDIVDIQQAVLETVPDPVEEVRYVALTPYDVWWKANGAEFIRKGHGQRNIVLKAALSVGVSAEEANAILQSGGTLKDKLQKVFRVV